MDTISHESRRSLHSGVAVTAFWVLCYFAARLALKELQLDAWLRVTVALLPVVPTTLFLWSAIQFIRGLDELHRRIHLEALAIAFPLSILLLWTLGLLELAIDLPAEDWSYRHIWVYLPLFYFAGLAITTRRYR